MIKIKIEIIESAKQSEPTVKREKYTLDKWFEEALISSFIKKLSELRSKKNETLRNR